METVLLFSTQQRKYLERRLVEWVETTTMPGRVMSNTGAYINDRAECSGGGEKKRRRRTQQNA